MPYHRPRPTPVGQAWQSARLQGLLARGQGQGLFGQNLPPNGIPMGGRMNLINTRGPVGQGVTAASGSFTNRISPPGISAPSTPRTFQTKGLKVSDILRGAQIGQFGANASLPPAPPALTTPSGFDQFGPPGAQVQAAQEVQGSTNALQSVTDLANTGAQKLSGEGAGGPESVLAPAQSFLSRTFGEKGSGKRSDIGTAMMAAGARMMKGSKDGTFATIGEGLEAGLGGYQELKKDRRIVEDRGIQAEDRATMLANRDTAGAAVEAMVASMPPDATVEIAAMRGLFAEGNAEAALKMGDVYLGRINYTDAIDELGGTYLTPDKLRLIKAMPPETGFAAVYEALNEGPAVEARAQALVSERGWTLADAMKLAVDGKATDAILRSPVGGGHRVVSSHGENYIVDMLTGKQVGDTYGDSDMPLRWAQLEALKGEAEVAGQSELMGQVVGDYNAFRPDVDGLKKASEALDILHSGDIGESSFNHVRHFVGKLVKSEEAIQLGSLENILKEIGIGNLSMFVGAISERELAEALSLAGSITDMHATLNDILARNMEGTLQSAADHNSKVATLKGSGVTLADEWKFDEADLAIFQEQAEAARAAGGRSMLDQSPTYQMNMERRGVQPASPLGEETMDAGGLAPSTSAAVAQAGEERGGHYGKQGKDTPMHRTSRQMTTLLDERGYTYDPNAPR